MTRAPIVENKPKMLTRNPNDVLVGWEDLLKSANAAVTLQICDELKEWKTIYR